VAVDVGQLLTEARFRRDAQALRLKPLPNGCDQRRGTGLAGGQALARRRAADVFFDGVDIGDPAQALGGDFGAVGIKDFLQFASGMMAWMPPLAQPTSVGAS